MKKMITIGILLTMMMIFAGCGIDMAGAETEKNQIEQKVVEAIEAAGTLETVVSSEDLLSTEALLGTEVMTNSEVVTNSETIVSPETTTTIDGPTVEVMPAGETTGTILSEEDAAFILSCVGEEWSEATGDCINDCKLIIDGNVLYYSSDCGTINDHEHDCHQRATEEERQQINAVLEKYVALGSHIHTLHEGDNILEHDPVGYCGNTITTVSYTPFGQKEKEAWETSFWGDKSVALTDLLLHLDYSEGICRCKPEYTVDTEFGKSYGLNLTDGYARYEDAQVSLTAEQLEMVREIMTWAEEDRKSSQKCAVLEIPES